MQKAKILKGRSEYLFRGVVKKNSGYRLRGINKSITYTRDREDVLSVLKKLWLSSEDCGLHTMRAGGCIMATPLGERFIKKGLFKNMVLGNQIELKMGILTPT